MNLSRLCVLLLASGALHCAQSDNRPKHSGEQIQSPGARTTSAETAFPDALYDSYDGNSFLESGLARRPINPDRLDIDLLNAAIFYSSIRCRQKAGLNPVHFSARMRNAAPHHSLVMARTGNYSHQEPDQPALRDPGARAAHFGVTLPRTAENIGTEFLLQYESGRSFWYRRQGQKLEFFYGSAQKPGPVLQARTYAGFAHAIVDNWLASPAHRENLLGKRFTLLGCGCARERPANAGIRIPSAVCTQDFAGR